MYGLIILKHTFRTDFDHTRSLIFDSGDKNPSNPDRGEKIDNTQCEFVLDIH